MFDCIKISEAFRPSVGHSDQTVGAFRPSVGHSDQTVGAFRLSGWGIATGAIRQRGIPTNYPIVIECSVYVTPWTGC